jgi:hypothetical protein
MLKTRPGVIRHRDLSPAREALEALARLPEINASLRQKGGVVIGNSILRKRGYKTDS